MLLRLILMESHDGKAAASNFHLIFFPDIFKSSGWRKSNPTICLRMLRFVLDTFFLFTLLLMWVEIGEGNK